MGTIVTRRKFTQCRFWGGILLLLCGLGACHDSNNTSSPTQCLLPGTYEYLKYTTLQAPIDAICSTNFTLSFDGVYRRVEYGETTITASATGFSLQAGEEGRWRMTVTCLGEDTAHVKVRLSDNCTTFFETQATATARTVIREDGIASLYIDQYLLEWTCGEALSCIVSESWELHQPGY